MLIKINENRSARIIQTAWRTFVKRENKISRIMGEEPKFTEFELLKQTLVRGPALSEPNKESGPTENVNKCSRGPADEQTRGVPTQ